MFASTLFPLRKHVGIPRRPYRIGDARAKKHYVAKKLLKPVETKIVGYLFVHNSKWFAKEPDVITSCKKYTSELEKFVKKYRDNNHIVIEKKT